MSPNLSKEFHLLRSNFLLALALLALARFSPSGSHEGVVIGLIGLPLFLFVPCFATLMVLGALGGELNHGTFAGMLTQPRSRPRIWWTKGALLLLLMTVLWLIWWLAFTHQFGSKLAPGNLQTVRLQSVLLAAAILSGGLWTVLLTRNVAAAFWFTVLPPCLFVILHGWLAGQQIAWSNTLFLVLLAAYTFTGTIAAYRLFLRAQDTQPMSLTVAPKEADIDWFRDSPFEAQSRSLHPRVMLLFKELRLQQGVIRWAALLGLIHLVVVILQVSIAPAHRGLNLDLLLTHFWVIWLICPLLIGSGLVAEERLLGMWASERCLPLSQSQKLLGKALVAGILAVGLGAICPVVLERNNFFLENRFDPTSILSDSSAAIRQGVFARGVITLATIIQLFPFHPQPLIVLSLISLSLVLLASFASSLCRSFLQSVSTAVGLTCLAMFTGVILEALQSVLHPGPFSSGLGVAFLLPTLAACLVWLTARNAAYLEIGPKLWGKNAGLLLSAIALSVGLSSLVYHRAWERLSALEPSHGAPALHLQDQIRITGGPRAFSFTAVDGRSWSADHAEYEWTLAERFFGNARIVPLSSPIFQLSGTNWAEVVHSVFDTVGIQKDGSLWVCDRPQLRLASTKFDPIGATQPFQMLPAGNERDWKRAVPFRSGVLLLKTDGTLWIWEREGLRGIRNYQGLLEQTPRRYSNEVDWDDLHITAFGWAYGFELLRKNGEAWLHPPQEAQLANRLKLEGAVELGRARYLDSGRAKERATVYCVEDPTEPFQVAVTPQGTLEIVARWQSSHDARRWSYQPTQIPLGADRPDRWISVASAQNVTTLVSLRSDGTLWKWPFHKSPSRAPKSATCSQLGRHSDWVAVVSHQREVLSLAADGSLWAWRFPSHFQSGWDSFLAPSAKPQLLGNILKTSP